MKKSLLLWVALILILVMSMVSCGNETGNSGSSNIDSDTNDSISNDSSNDSSYNSSGSVTTDSTPDTQNPSSDNSNDTIEPEKSQTSSVASFTTEQNVGYYPVAKYTREVYTLDFPDYEMGEWYRIVKTYEELTQIDNQATVNSSLFEENYIVIVHRHYNGGLYYDYIGYKNAKATEQGFEITLYCYEPEVDWNDQYREVETVEYLVVPKAEIRNISSTEGKLTLNYSEMDLYDRLRHSVSIENVSEFENGSVWLFENSEEHATFMEEYGIRHPSYGSGYKNFVRLVIYYEAGTNIGIGYSNCRIEGDEFYITNEAFEGDNVTLIEPTLCVIFIKKYNFPTNALNGYNYNIIVQENVVERLYSTN